MIKVALTLVLTLTVTIRVKKTVTMTLAVTGTVAVTVTREKGQWKKDKGHGIRDNQTTRDNQKATSCKEVRTIRLDKGKRTK